MNELAQLALGMSVGAIFLVICLVMLPDNLSLLNVQARLDQIEQEQARAEVPDFENRYAAAFPRSADAPRVLSAGEYVDTMVGWPARKRKSTSVVASADAK